MNKQTKKILKLYVLITTTLIITAGGILYLGGMFRTSANNKKPKKTIELSEQDIIKILEDNKPQFITLDKKVEKPQEPQKTQEEIMEEKINEYNVPLSHDLKKWVYNVSEEFNVPYSLSLSVMKSESDFNVKAKCNNDVGGSYSYGYMQLNKKYEKWIGQVAGIDNFNIENPYHNIKGGIALLNYYRQAGLESGANEDNVIYYQLNQYNMGSYGYKKFRNKYGRLSRSYDKKVLKYQSDLTKFKKFID